MANESATVAALTLTVNELINRVARLEDRVTELQELAEGPPWDDDETLTGFPDDSDGRY